MIGMGGKRESRESVLSAQLDYNIFIEKKKLSEKYSNLHIWFGLVVFYGISTTVGYLMPNPVFRYILHIYDL